MASEPGAVGNGTGNENPELSHFHKQQRQSEGQPTFCAEVDVLSEHGLRRLVRNMQFDHVRSRTDAASEGTEDAPCLGPCFSSPAQWLVPPVSSPCLRLIVTLQAQQQNNASRHSQKRNGAKAQSHARGSEEVERNASHMGRRGPKPPSSGRQPLISTAAARITTRWPCLWALANSVGLTMGAISGPSKWNLFRLFWGGQGKQVVQVNPKNTTSRRTRWALRVLRYLANFWSTLGPAFDQRNRGCQSRRFDSSPPNRGQGAVPVFGFCMRTHPILELHVGAIVRAEDVCTGQ
ncbi:LOW QUALITY PROTEIN: hypothetical protein N5P37_000771 [Trichoderma harzianum]|nr:LOW QUALITY PROTEIN: hypothetical protein N5P37_000771 [Trichoderma harzianum]